MKTITKWLCIAAPLLMLISCADEGADKILHNASVWTVDQDNPEAEAVAIKGEQIKAVGDESEVMQYRTDATEVMDLDGAMVLPGFQDNHVHFTSAARFLEFNIMQVSTQDEFIERVESVTERLEEGEWILGGLWGAYDDWEAGAAAGGGTNRFTPDISLVEDITAEYPMFIRRFDSSEFAVNRKAMEEVGLDPYNPEAEGIEFETDQDGVPTGIITGDEAEAFFDEHTPDDFSRERRTEQTRNALAEMAKYGVTSVSDMSDDTQVEIYEELEAEDELSARIHYRYHLERWEELAEDGIQPGHGSDRLRLGSLKGHIDGIMGNSTARFFEPYDHEPDQRGNWRRLMLDENDEPDPDQFLDYMVNADQAGLQLTIHAIGDEANNLLLDLYERMEEKNGERDRRFRLVHAQVMQDDDIQRMGELGMIAEVQPIHLSDDMRWMEERIGSERSEGAYAFRSIDESGAMLSFGTDWPGTAASEYPINPMLGLYAATTRKTLLGEPEGGWFPDERIDMETAVEAYTYNTSYANHMEHMVGSIKPGLQADLSVWEGNIFELSPEELLENETLYTLIDGEVIYSRD